MSLTYVFCPTRCLTGTLTRGHSSPYSDAIACWYRVRCYVVHASDFLAQMNHGLLRLPRQWRDEILGGQKRRGEDGNNKGAKS